MDVEVNMGLSTVRHNISPLYTVGTNWGLLLIQIEIHEQLLALLYMQLVTIHHDDCTSV